MLLCKSRYCWFDANSKDPPIENVSLSSGKGSSMIVTAMVDEFVSLSRVSWCGMPENAPEGSAGKRRVIVN